MTSHGPDIGIAVDGAGLQRRIDELALISEAPAPVVTRVLFSEADLRGREYVRRAARDAGLVVREDAVGNIFARWEGSEPGLPAVGSGSHTDAIPNAGRYDGVVGVLGAFEALAALKRAGFRPRRSLEVVMFTAEEPTRFGLGCLGSRLMEGSIPVEKARALKDREGRTLEELRAAAGCVGALESVRLPSGYYHAFVELHIEQGPVLEARNIPIGIVEHIAGPSSYRVTLHGEGGTTAPIVLPRDYAARERSVTAAQLKKAGVRLAALLNTVLGSVVHSAAVQTIVPETASSHLGETATVKGAVADVHTARSGVTFIDIGGRYPHNAFTAVIFSEDAGKFPDVGALSGRVVEITGLVRLYKGKPEIILRSASQLKAE